MMKPVNGKLDMTMSLVHVEFDLFHNSTHFDKDIDSKACYLNHG